VELGRGPQRAEALVVDAEGARDFDRDGRDLDAVNDGVGVAVVQQMQVYMAIDHLGLGQLVGAGDGGAVLARALGGVERGVGLGQQLVAVEAVRRIARHAAALCPKPPSRTFCRFSV
jgi:hypothetical protein